MEPGKPGAKHGANLARPRLALEMDRLVAGGDRRVHDVLSPAVPKTNRRRTDHAFSSTSGEGNCQRGSCCRNDTLDLAISNCRASVSDAVAFHRKALQRPLGVKRLHDEIYALHVHLLN